MESIFKIYGWDPVKYTVVQQGLINNTYDVTTSTGNYILQTINHNIFKQPHAIDHNINAISDFLKINAPQYLFTHLIKSLNGSSLVEWEGQYYRAFHKINGYALSVLDNPSQAYEAAKQFGYFTQILTNFNASSLQITLPDFHNLSLRYQQFLTAVNNGNPSRIAQAQEAIKYLKEHAHFVQQYEQFIAHKESQIRVTHHDTKISNVLFNQADGKETAICVIDLDTVMPGYFISDIGDMCRTCLCAVSEEEANLDLIKVDKLKWDAIQNGYLAAMNNTLSNFELDHLFFGGQFMIYMQALRFLTDHLNNDIYYGAKKEGKNYVRALNQIRLLEVYNELK